MREHAFSVFKRGDEKTLLSALNSSTPRATGYNILFFKRLYGEEIKQKYIDYFIRVFLIILVVKMHCDAFNLQNVD